MNTEPITKPAPTKPVPTKPKPIPEEWDVPEPKKNPTPKA